MRKISQKGEAKLWLASRLADGGVQSNVLYEEGAKLGWSKTVLLRAASDMDITSTSVSGEYRRRTVWTLP